MGALFTAVASGVVGATAEVRHEKTLQHLQAGLDAYMARQVVLHWGIVRRFKMVWNTLAKEVV